MFDVGGLIAAFTEDEAERLTGISKRQLQKRSITL